MIEITVRKYLKTKLVDVPVFMGEVPAKAPEEYVLLTILDTGRTNYIDAATFNIESYSTTLLKSAALNQKVKEAMFNITSEPSISSSKCGGGSQNIDTATKTYCYETIFNLRYAE